MIKAGNVKYHVLKALSRTIGSENVTRLLIRRNYQHYGRTKILFVHVPKCAGTSISAALYGRSLGHRRAAELRAYSPERFGELFSFAIIRDPIERALSAYRYAREGGTNEGWIKEHPDYQASAFKDFDTFATEWLPSNDLSELDLVFQPQAQFVTDDCNNVIVSRLILLDQIDVGWNQIVAENSSLSDRPLRTLNETKPKSRSEEIVSDKARQALRNFYADDFRIFETLQRTFAESSNLQYS